jgi:membrane protein required for colicin V production
MSAIDIIILSSLAGSAALGFRRGLIRQLISFAGLIGGIIVAGRFYEPVAEFLHGPDGGGIIADLNWARIISFVGLLILFTVALNMVGSALRFVTKLLFLGWADHLLGAVLGFLLALTSVMAMVVVATVFPVPGLSDSLQDSQVARVLSSYVPVVLAMLPPEFQSFYAMMQVGLPLPIR